MTGELVHAAPGATASPVAGDRLSRLRSSRQAPLQGAGGRLLYVDWLRVLAVAGVFAVHVSEVFNPYDEWHIANAQRSPLIGEIAVLMAPWIMPLFMLLAGVSAWFSLSHRGNAAYFRERVFRVALPLVVGTLLLVPPQVYLERRLRHQFSGSFIDFFPHFFQGIYPNGNLSWHHLWFLAHLMLYAVVTLPLFRYLQTDRGRIRLRRLARLTAGPAGLLWLALPLILERNLLWGLFRERHYLTADWSNHALLLVAYVYGFILAGEPWLGLQIDRQWRNALSIAFACTALLVYLTWTNVLPYGLPAPYALGYLGFWAFYSVAAWAWMIGMLGAARQFVRRENAVLDYGRQIGYGWYLVHQPVIIAVAYFIVPWQASVGLKFVVLTGVSLAGTLLGAEAIRRIPVISTLLGVSTARRGAVGATQVPV